MLSKSKRRLTIGDSGRIAYAEYVDKVPLGTHWQGQPAGTGIPAHPTRKLLFDPPLYEFSQPVSGSYPPWYDPSYWYEGVAPHFSLRGQLWVLYRASNAYLKMFSRAGTLYIVALSLFLIRKAGRWAESAAASWVVWVPAIAALGMYALVLVETRYVSAFALTLLTSVLARAQVTPPAEKGILRQAMLAITLAPAAAIACAVLADTKDVIAPRPFEKWQVAQALQQRRISPSSWVGYVGTGLDAYWAHLAQVRIIAEVPERDESSFLHANSLQKEHVLETFASLGTTAVLTRSAVVANSMPGWQPIRDTRYYIHILTVASENRP
jgi:hypothetical protein